MLSNFNPSCLFTIGESNVDASNYYHKKNIIKEQMFAKVLAIVQINEYNNR